MASMTVRTMTLRRLLRPGAFSVARSSACGQWGGAVSVTTTPSRSFGSSSSGDYVFSEHEKPFLEKGWLDERGLTQFKTLHENQVRACAIFADRELYGIHNPETDEFDFKTYKEFGQQVNTVRHVLKDLGENKEGLRQIYIYYICWLSSFLNCCCGFIYVFAHFILIPYSLLIPIC